MQIDGYEYESEFVRRVHQEGREAGREEGREAGREEGREAGREEGREAGRVETLALAVLEVLAARQLVVDDAAHARIVGCREVAQLHVWLTAAVTTPSVEQLLS